MKLPKRIDPDPVLEAIVDVRFESKVPHEIFLGVIFQALKNDFEYASAATEEFVSRTGNKVQIGNQPHLFQSPNIRLLANPNSLVFNVLGEYPGWGIYFPLIKSTLERIHALDFIGKYTRVGVRYISVFPDLDLFAHTKVRVSVDLPGQPSSHTLLRTEQIEEPFRILINLSKGQMGSIEKSNDSVADVDVITALKSTDFEEVCKAIDAAHLREKEVFFGLIKEDSLPLFNPTY